MKSQALRIALALTLAVALSGCAGTRVNTQDDERPWHSINEFRDQRFAEVADPWEGVNRNMYRFNFYLDKYVLIPVVNGYEYVTPTFVQNRVSGFYNNLNEVRNLSNSVFQLKGKESATTLGRFVTNSTIGLGGMFDPASKLGMPRHDQDFGKTLGYWGAGSGPYVVLPFFGPSSLRDTAGLVFDDGLAFGIYTMVDPFGSTSTPLLYGAGFTALEGVDMRHQQQFRYYGSGYPFEYYMVRFLYHQKRELESGKRIPAE